MAKITNRETLELQQDIRQHIALQIATLKAMDMAVRRDYRNSIVTMANENLEQARILGSMADVFKSSPNKEGA